MDVSTMILSPLQTISEVIKIAFHSEGRKRKAAMHILRSILKLAAQRGFSQAPAFLQYFNHHQTNGKESKRWLNKVLDYVGSDELMILTQQQTAISS
jgi:hypothetical protein